MPKPAVERLHAYIFGKGDEIGTEDCADKAARAAEHSGSKDREDRQPAGERVDSHAPQRPAESPTHPPATR